METSVKLISSSQSHIDGIDAADLIAYIARVSNPSNQMNTETSEKLLRYLIKYKHWSPFEMVNVVIEVNSTRDIVRQLLRHRSFKFQEFSQRYANANEMGFVLREARLQDAKNRQNSIETEDEFLQDHWEYYQNQVVEASRKAYDWAIAQGIAKEQARVVLPEGLTRSRVYVNGDVRSWIHYYFVRSDVSTQKEHREVATKCFGIITDLYPALKDLTTFTQ
jgi:thymidylate synthase (FAD)